LVRAIGLTDEVLSVAAMATSLGPLAALVVSSVALRSVFGVLPPLATFARCALAAAVGYSVSGLVPQQTAWMAPLAMIAGGLAYLAALFVLRELKASDLSELVTALKKRKA
ncbi:MAG: hypothetical protein JWN48_5832, partial [Myxococcaceae bacterium]|nr:hypothetical protein [Myxococcaceae bacterium]